MVVAKPTMSVFEAAVAMREKGVGSVVIEEKGQLAGIFTERDLLNRVVAAGKNPEKTALSDVMTKDVMGLEGDKPLLHALHLMHQNAFRHVPVLENGRPIGMVSARDALGIEWQQFQREVKLADDIAEILA
ncbi:MAG: CBS domain-containing protein [Rhodocyclaceae bacterium]|nr:CBS domain-containing protein [Rhodocyclaceae bacterium]